MKTLEEKGIGRPSTYAAIISTIQGRKYVVLEQRRFVPTELGFTVTDLLVKHFPDVMDVAFTAGMETKLDDIEEGDLDWVDVLTDFWGPFKGSLEEAQQRMENMKKPPVETGEMCPNCGRPLVIRESKYGQFLGCSGYPKCKTVASKKLGEACPVPGCGGQMVEVKPGSSRYRCSNHPTCSFVSRSNGEPAADAEEGKLAETSQETDQKCPKCGKPLVRRRGKYGEFLGCSGYPKCKTIVSLGKQEGAEGAASEKSAPQEIMPCPVEGCGGMIVRKKSRYGDFYACNRYPKCKHSLGGMPLDRKCPECGSMLVEKHWRGRPQGVKCSSEDCGYKEASAEAKEEVLVP